MCAVDRLPDLLLKVTLDQNSAPRRASCTCSIVQIVPASPLPDTGRHRLSVSKVLPLALAVAWAKTGESLADSSMTLASEEAASTAIKRTMRLVDREIIGIRFCQSRKASHANSSCLMSHLS